MWVEFVVGSLLCSERFFSRYSGFLLSLETNTSKFNEFLRTPKCSVGKQMTIITIIITIIIESEKF